MTGILKLCFFIGLVACCFVHPAYGVWNKIGQFNDAVSCGYFFDPDNGLVGLGQYGQLSNNFVGTQPLAIYWTNDGGKNWTQSNIPSGGRGRVSSIYMQNKVTGYASIYSWAYSVWKTTDGGRSWQDFSKGNNDLSTCIYATRSAIIKTTWFSKLGGSSIDGGASYSQVFNGGFNGSDGIDFVDDNNGVVTMGPPGRTSWLTNDGGVTWHAGGNLPESWSVYAVKGTKIFLTMSEDDGNNPGQTVYWSQDGGQNWSSRFKFPGSPSFTGHIAGAGNTLYVQTDNSTRQGLFRSDDLGISWVNVGGPSNVRDTRFAVTGCRGEVVYAFDNQGGVWKTTDGGNGAYGFTPRIGYVNSVKAGDTAVIPIFIDSTKPQFPITIFSGSISMNTDLLTPVRLDTTGTLSQNMIFDTLYAISQNSFYFQIRYKTAIPKISFAKPLIYIRAAAYVTKKDSTALSLGAVNIAEGASIPPVICSGLSGSFTLQNECGDSTLREFIKTGMMPQFLSINPNPSSSSSVDMRIYLPTESDLSLDILDENGKFKGSGIPYGHYNKGNQRLNVNISAFTNGVYYLKLHLGTGSYLTGSVVIIR